MERQKLIKPPPKTVQMKKLINLLPFIFLSAVAPLHAAEDKSTQPNLVIILADDLGYGDVRALNPDRSKIATPHLDQFASEGMTFTDAHSGSSVCTPTRYGLLTGRYAWRTRLQRGVLDGGSDEPLIAEDRLTLGGLLRQHGYATACIGKWHLGFESDMASEKGKAFPVGATILGGPTTRGFDSFFGCSNARTMSAWIEGDRVTETIEPVAMLPRLAERAETWLGERADEAKAGRPFFLYLPLTSPHTPIVPAPEWQGKSGLGAYADFVMQTDAVVGRVLDALDEQGLAKDTLVIFSADNGCSPAAKVEDLEKAGHFPSAIFRGYKADIWEGGHRVPFLVRWPGRVAPGSENARTLCLTDIIATCADLLGVPLPENSAEDSVSFLPSLLGENDAPPREPVIHHSIEGRFAIRQDRWKLALCAGSGGWSKGGGRDSPQLYDLATDPGETKNLSKQHPDVTARLTALMERYVAEGRSTPGAKQRNDVPVEIHQRKSR